MLHIKDTSQHTQLERAIILGSDSSHTTTGLNIGNHNTRPFIWTSNNATGVTVNVTTFTHGFGWLYSQNGNLQLIRRNGSTTNTPVMTYNRANGCVTFTNTSPGRGSDDRLKFNEKNITNALHIIMQLSPEIYDKYQFQIMKMMKMKKMKIQMMKIYLNFIYLIVIKSLVL